MNVNVVERLDKLVVGLPYPKSPKGMELAMMSVMAKQLIQYQQKEYVALMKHIESMIKVGKHFVKKTKQKGLKRYCVLSEQNDTPLFYVQLGCINKTWVINFEWNPSKLSPEEQDEFLANLSIMLNHHYEELYEFGVVSHAEFAVDVYGVDISSLALISLKKSAYQRVGTTIYSGRRGSANVLTIYDKAKELGKSEKHVRIEARIKRRDLTLQQLVENSAAIHNPFNRQIVVDVNQLQLVAQELQIPPLAELLKELGLHEAVKNFAARCKIFGHLMKNTVDWWQPDKFWTQHQALLKALEPKLYH